MDEERDARRVLVPVLLAGVLGLAAFAVALAPGGSSAPVPTTQKAPPVSERIQPPDRADVFTPEQPCPDPGEATIHARPYASPRPSATTPPGDGDGSRPPHDEPLRALVCRVR